MDHNNQLINNQSKYSVNFHMVILHMTNSKNSWPGGIRFSEQQITMSKQTSSVLNEENVADQIKYR